MLSQSLKKYMHNHSHSLQLPQVSFFWYSWSLLTPPPPPPPYRPTEHSTEITILPVLKWKVFINSICEPTMAISKNKPSCARQLPHKINLVIKFGVKKQTNWIYTSKKPQNHSKKDNPKMNWFEDILCITGSIWEGCTSFDKICKHHFMKI